MTIIGTDTTRTVQVHEILQDTNGILMTVLHIAHDIEAAKDYVVYSHTIN